MTRRNPHDYACDSCGNTGCDYSLDAYTHHNPCPNKRARDRSFDVHQTSIRIAHAMGLCEEDES